MTKYIIPLLTSSILVLVTACGTPKEKKTQQVEDATSTQLIEFKLSEILEGQWKTEGSDGVVANWLEFDLSDNSFSTWLDGNSRPGNSSGNYKIVSDTILELSYSEYNEIRRFGFDSVSLNYLDMWSFGLSTSNIIYKREALDAITFDKVKLTNVLDTMFSVEIPKTRDLWGKHQSIVDSINTGILATFGITDFNERQSEEFRWGNVRSTYKIKKEILHLQISATYYGGNYPNDYQYDLFYDLKSGKELQYSQMPFEALFTLAGYLDFLNKYWLNGAKKKFEAAEICAGSEPFCTYYDISEYSVNDNKLSISLTNSCFARVAQFCSPKYRISVEVDSILQYLNKMGKSILLEPNNFSSDSFDKIITNQQLFNNDAMNNLLQNNHFIFGKIDNKYPISMAFNIDTDGKISGYYYYNSKLQKLKLEGQKKDGVLYLTETVNKQQTGFFELTYSNKYELNRSFVLPSPTGKYSFLSAVWRNPENTKSFDVIFSEVKSIIKN